MNKVKVEIIGLSYSQSQSGAYALILGVPGENKRLPIIIGGFEAQAIAIELEKMKPARPLTHDLFKSFAEKFDITLKEVVINKFQEGVFYSMLICEKDNKVTYIDSRTSDAVALALRFNCPIYCEKSIIDEVGINIEIEDNDEQSSEYIEPEETLSEKDKLNLFEDDSDAYYNSYTLIELEELLQKAIDEEAYEKASKIRDAIKRHNKEEQE